jgi:hemerythrin superfamily protein
MTAAAAGPTLAGAVGMHVVRFLTNHHRAIEAHLESLMRASAADKGRVFAEAADRLMAHVILEEERFYPEVRARRTEDILLESLEEHLSLKRVVADLVRLSVEDPHFEPKLHVLKEQVEHHHKEEEEHLFPKVPSLLGEERCETLGAELDRFEHELLGKHPRKWALAQTEAAAPLSQ